MKQKAGKFFSNKWLIIITLILVIGVIPIGFISYFMWYSRQCNLIYTQVTECVGNRDLAIYGEYNGETVKIAYENRNSIWDVVTEKIVDLTSADDKPAAQPVILRFGDTLEMDVYPTDSRDLFVKHISGNKIKYYFVKNTSDFSYLEKMVSKDGWNVPNTVE